MKRTIALLGTLTVAGFGVLALSVPAQAETEDCKTFVTENVVRADSGKHGTWAGDVFTRTVTVCLTNDQTNGYQAVFKDDGSFTTIKGTSPGTGKDLAAGIKGTFKGGATYQFTTNAKLDLNTLAAYKPSEFPSTSEWVGKWLGSKFVSGNYDEDGNKWGWTYSTACETWVNSGSATTGDIIGKICAPTVEFVNAACEDKDAHLKVTNPNSHVTLAVAFNGEARTIAMGGSVTHDFNSGVVLLEARQLRAKNYEYKAPTGCPTTEPTTKPTTEPTATATPPVAGGGNGAGGLPVTGDNTGKIVAAGGVLLLGGFVAALIARRRKTRFVV